MLRIIAEGRGCRRSASSPFFVGTEILIHNSCDQEHQPREKSPDDPFDDCYHVRLHKSGNEENLVNYMTWIMENVTEKKFTEKHIMLYQQDHQTPPSS
jgi:hypothetical protein